MYTSTITRRHCTRQVGLVKEGRGRPGDVGGCILGALCYKAHIEAVDVLLALWQNAQAAAYAAAERARLLTTNSPASTRRPGHGGERYETFPTAVCFAHRRARRICDRVCPGRGTGAALHPQLR